MRRRPIADFSDAFDWRPLDPVELPFGVKTCDLCGVIAGTAFELGCSHAFCATCYGGLRAEVERRCPIDGTAVDDGVVERTQLTEEHLSGLKVRCWNAAFGCTFAGSLYGMLDHHRTKCNFHFVSCPRCRESVLQSRMLHHCKNDCPGKPEFYVRKKTSATTRRRTPTRSEVVAPGHDCLDVVTEVTRMFRMLLESLEATSLRGGETAVEVFLAGSNCEKVITECVDICTDLLAHVKAGKRSASSRFGSAEGRNETSESTETFGLATWRGVEEARCNGTAALATASARTEGQTSGDDVFAPRKAEMNDQNSRQNDLVADAKSEMASSLATPERSAPAVPHCCNRGIALGAKYSCRTKDVACEADLKPNKAVTDAPTQTGDERGGRRQAVGSATLCEDVDEERVDIEPATTDEACQTNAVLVSDVPIQTAEEDAQGRETRRSATRYDVEKGRPIISRAITKDEACQVNTVATEQPLAPDAKDRRLAADTAEGERAADDPASLQDKTFDVKHASDKLAGNAVPPSRTAVARFSQAARGTKKSNRAPKLVATRDEACGTELGTSESAEVSGRERDRGKLPRSTDRATRRNLERTARVEGESSAEEEESLADARSGELGTSGATNYRNDATLLEGATKHSARKIVTVTWDLKGFASLKAGARKRRTSDVFALCDYAMRLKVSLKSAEGGSTFFQLYLLLCRGPRDDRLEWPFVKRYRLVLSHPRHRWKNIVCEYDPLSPDVPLLRPKESRVVGWGCKRLCEVSAMESEGFVENDTVTVCVEVFQ